MELTHSTCNAKLSSAAMEKVCVLTAAAKKILQNAFERMGMSARAYDRILKVARTIADLDGCETIEALPAIDSLPRLYEHLLRHGYGETVVQDLFYNNLMRVVR